MSQIVTTKVGRFRHVTPDAWLWECPCGQWSYLTTDQWAGRVSVDHASQGCPVKYHETHNYEAELVVTMQARILTGEPPIDPESPVEPTPEPPTARNLYHVEAFDEANKRIGGFAVFGPDMGTALAKAASNIEVKLRPSQPRMTVTLLSAMKPTGAPAPCVWRDIASAPKDGTVILVHGGIAYWYFTGKDSEGEWRTLTGVNYPGEAIKWPVTEWMPMPSFHPLTVER